LKLELVPTPFVEPLVFPAKVETKAVERMMWRIRLLDESVTKAARPSGKIAII
jgi:hypothetical protein